MLDRRGMGFMSARARKSESSVGRTMFIPLGCCPNVCGVWLVRRAAVEVVVNPYRAERWLLDAT